MAAKLSRVPVSSFSADKEARETDVRLHESLVTDLESLLEDQASTDLEFAARGGKVRAHKLIVLCRCKEDKTKRLLRGAGEQKFVSVRLENFSVRTVRNVVRYLYSGKISLQKEDLFEVLLLCSELGLPVLQTFCVERLGRTLSIDSVCSSLIKAHSSLQASSSKHSGVSSLLEEIMEKCFGFIEANTKDVFQSDDFLRLPKELVVAIISSNKLSVPEEEIWRAVIQWGQHNTNVHQTMLLWTEADRSKMKDQLANVLEHVKVMEISSEVFASEVEPTGLLPMEMTLARYRQAAVHGKGGSRLEQSRPRSGVQEPFVDSEILAGRADLQMQINEWYGQPSQEWILLFRGSRDGFHARKFHSCCDEKGATVVVVKTPSGCIFGGYADVPWSSRFKRGKFASSPKSFLFTLVNPSNIAPSRFEINQPAYAINNHPSNGPIFGSGADLCLSSDCNKNKDSYSQLPFSYGNPSLPQHLLTGEQYFLVEDYEVFGLAT